MVKKQYHILAGVFVMALLAGPAAGLDGATASPHGATASPHGATASPHGATAPPHGATASPHGAAASPQPATGAPVTSALASDTTELERLLWTASTLQRVLAERDYATALLLGLAGRDGPAGANTATEIATLVSRVRASRVEIDACRTADAAQGTLCALERLHSLVPPSLAPGLADEAASLVAQLLRPAASAMPHLDALVLRRQDAFQDYLEERLQRLLPAGVPVTAAGGVAPDAAASAAARALEPWLRERVGHGIGDGTAAILAANPTLASLLRLHPVLGDISGVTLQPLARQQLVGQFHSFFGSVVDSAHVALRSFGAMGDGVAAALTRGVTGALTGDVTGVLAGAPPASDLAGWAAKRSLVYLASRAAAQTGDSGLPASLSALGNAATDLHRGIGDLPSSLLTAGRSAAAFALTGNVLGMASGLTALLNAAGGGHGTAAAEVRALRGVVDSLRVQVDGRFDHLDSAVEDVLVSLSGGFERLERAVAMSGEASRREIAAVHADVTALNQRFDRLDANIQSYLIAGFDRDYARTLARCLEHRERFAPPHDRMDFPTFSGCLVEFRSRGAADARDALLADRETPAGDDVAVVAALADTGRHNFARRLPLVARAASARHGHPAPPRALANPVEWAVAAEAYVRMLDDWPEHAAALTTADLDALVATGREIDDWSRSLTTDEAGRPRADLFEAVIRDYTAAATDLRAAVESFAQGQQERRLQRIPLDSLVRQLEPAAGGEPLPVPRGAVERVPADALAAAMLGLHALELRYHVALRDSVVRDNFRRPFLRGTRHDRHHYALPTLIVEAVMAGSTVATFETAGAPIRHRTDEMAGGEDSDRVRRTRTWVADPAARFLAAEWPRISQDADWTPRPPTPTALAPLRAAVETELERHAAQTLDDLFRAVCTASPMPSGAAPVADRIRRALHTMTTARTLFGAYARAGLGRSAAFDPALAELLADTRGLPGQAALCGRLQGGQRMLRVLWLDDEPGRAAARATSFLARRFADAASLPEPLESVATPLERLEAARRIQRTRTKDGP
jgi:hypothetical protein